MREPAARTAPEILLLILAFAHPPSPFPAPVIFPVPLFASATDPVAALPHTRLAPSPPSRAMHPVVRPHRCSGGSFCSLSDPRLAEQRRTTCYAREATPTTTTTSGNRGREKEKKYTGVKEGGGRGGREGSNGNGGGESRERYVNEKLEESGNLLRRLAHSPLSSLRERRRLLNAIDRRSLPSGRGEIFNAEIPREIPENQAPRV